MDTVEQALMQSDADLLMAAFMGLESQAGTLLAEMVREVKEESGSLSAAGWVLWSPTARYDVAQKLREVADLLDKVE